MCRRLAGAIATEAPAMMPVAEEVEDLEQNSEEEMASVVEKALGRCGGFAKEYDRRGIHHHQTEVEAEVGIEGAGKGWADYGDGWGDS